MTLLVRNAFKLSPIKKVDTLNALGIKEAVKVNKDIEHLIGIEIELENVKLEVTPNEYVWRSETDGSLRNRGIEFVTNGPIFLSHAEAALVHLEKCMSNYVASPRCSSHVHFNARDMDHATVQRLYEFYMHVEQSLFKYVGHNRYKNIFCVPLWDCVYGLDNFHKWINIDKQLVRWSKYTAMNFASLLEKGTVEFRHYPGYTNRAHYLEWIAILGRMVRFCINTKVNIVKDLSLADMQDILKIMVYPTDFANAKLLLDV